MNKTNISLNINPSLLVAMLLMNNKTSEDMMLYFLYAVKSEKGWDVRYTPDIYFDAFYHWEFGGKCIYLLANPLPLGVVHALKQYIDGGYVPGFLKGLFDKSGLFSFFSKNGGTNEEDVRNTVQGMRGSCYKLLRRLGINHSYISDTDKVVPVDVKKVFKLEKNSVLKLVEKRLQGRVLLGKELESNLRENGNIIPASINLILQHLYLEDRLEIVPGVGYNRPGVLKCFRCGAGSNIIPVDCSLCGQGCYYCENCIMLGAVRFCEPLYIGKDDTVSLPELIVKPRLAFGKLTLSQERCGEQLEGFMEDKSQQIGLLEAVCGAGKTEVTFQAVSNALLKGQNILYAVPRRDVVVELYPRFCQAFPEITISAIYGGSDKKYGEARITLATTHQVMRFNRKFDLLILDEADAYPYRGDPILEAVLERALKQGSKVIYVTATPDNKILQKAREKGVVITMPARYHGRALPMPQILKCPIVDGEGRLGNKIYNWLYKKGIEDKGRVLIFVPTIAHLEQALKLLEHSFGNGNCVKSISSRDGARDAKKIAFVEGSYPFLVTTTILERGITVPGVHVMVLWADHGQVFDVGTLIQIAGRADRTKDNPGGEVIFAASEISDAMNGAVRRLEQLNSLARKEGFVR